MRLLIVEDSNDLRSVMKMYLGMFGHEVSDVSSVDEALREMETETFDCVILDLIMPRKPGTALLPTLIDQRIPYIVATGLPMTDAARFCPNDTVILTKPFVFSELATALDTVRDTKKIAAQSIGRPVKDAPM